jgi:hypothetical protein
MKLTLYILAGALFSDLIVAGLQAVLTILKMIVVQVIDTALAQEAG